MVASLDHIGDTPKSGHYVTFLKQDSGKWIKFDDEESKDCSLKQANTRNNYILLFKRKEINNQGNESAEEREMESHISSNFEECFQSLQGSHQLSPTLGSSSRSTIQNKLAKEGQDLSLQNTEQSDSNQFASLSAYTDQ